MAALYPRSRDVQTSQGGWCVALGKRPRSQGAGKAKLVTLVSKPGWEWSWLSPASSNHGALLSGAQGRCEMHENVLLSSCYGTCW